MTTRGAAEAALTAEDVTVRSGDTLILDAVSLQVGRGESVAVVGPSGSGKSTLLGVLAGLTVPTSGSVHRPDWALRQGVVLQGYGLVSLLTAAENVELVLQLLPGPTRAEVRARSAAALDGVGLTSVADQLIESLSGGQQQRVAIARMLVTEPDLVVADEVTAELDPVVAGGVVDRILAVTARGGSVVIATHDPAVASRCERTLRLVDGRLVDH